MAKQKVASKKEVSTTSDNYPTERPSWMGDQGKMRGNEGVTTADLTIPRISIIQDLSPQWKEGKDEYIEGAKPKMAFNTATQELYGSELFIIPVFFRKEWVIWKDIDSGGGFRGAFSSAAEAQAELAKLDDASDCEIVDTHQHFVLVVDKDDPESIHQAVVSMSKSQCKPSRQLNTMIQNVGGDRFERMYKLEVVDAQNAAGQEYYNWKPTQMGYVTEAQFKAAEVTYEAIKRGELDVKRDQDAAPEHKVGETSGKSEF
jgi:hypothetical protein